MKAQETRLDLAKWELGNAAGSRVCVGLGWGFEASLSSSMERRHVAERLSVAEHDVSAATHACDLPY
eukprot:1394255-Amphidinium_carterae.1